MGKRAKPEEIIAKLREVEVRLARGEPAAAAARAVGVTEQSYYRWRKEYMGKYDEALKLLPEGFPKFADDWVDFHIRGMISLGLGKVSEAVDVFRTGLLDAPFYQQKQYFRTALAAAMLRQREWSSAIAILDKSEPKPANYLLLVHAFAMLGDMKSAKRSFEAVNDNVASPLTILKKEIGAKFGLSTDQPTQDDDWIFKKEAEIVLWAA